MIELKINKDFSTLIPPLAEDEYSKLQESIKQEGCREPLSIWNGVIVDGHNRYKICCEYNIEFKTQEIEFEDEGEAKIWIINNQLARRNLEPFQKTNLILKKKEIIAERAKENEKIRKGKQPGASLTNSSNLIDPIHTRKELAKEAGVSEDTVARVEFINKNAGEEAIEKLNKGESSINEVFTKLKKVEKEGKRRQEIEEQREKLEKGELDLPKGLYEIIVVDPPWPYGGGYDAEGRRVSSPYPEMSLEEIKNIELPSSEDCVLWLWTTHKFLPEAFDILDTWDFEYKAALVWDKQKMGMGSWLRMQCEFCLLGIKGKPKWNLSNERDFISEARGEHSRKPNRFYEMVEKLCIGRKLDFFSRELRKNWDSYGIEVDKFKEDKET